ncbi:DUF3626 domain-containing protein [Shewanella phaeophyticola]|uniref:DUF3626 domain-containing protein n=1 Tax=Shewanella phaeophyticola TaxID=2978345 RepID=A0ABT2P2B2_9GAMM|nr:DUF3626 domain-containing protein [Shewanella sp. KJ10-1]MCT8985406.1 DUF3626 domain-containing protein [Shewanella sp. KJ10-1]
MKLTAHSHIEKTAYELRDHAHAVIKNVLLMSNISTLALQMAMRQLSSHSRVALHFHPDRIDSRGLCVVDGLLRDGVYKSQFETHVSNGHLSPELGGSRDHWENQLFGNCYSGIKHRPKYGALDFGLCPLGPAPRFGSCYLVTHSHILPRCTFSYMDSYRLPKEKGTIKCFDVILAALLSESFERQYALGCVGFKPSKLINYFSQHLTAPTEKRFDNEPCGNLDHYIEAQIHGDVSLDKDVAVLVADPSFMGSQIGDSLVALCDEYDIELLWHNGRQMRFTDVPDDFRGAAMPTLAQSIAEDQIINAEIIGRAAYQLQKQPTSWSERGAHTKKLQDLKLLWHVLVKYGHTPSNEPFLL